MESRVKLEDKITDKILNKSIGKIPIPTPEFLGDRLVDALGSYLQDANAENLFTPLEE